MSKQLDILFVNTNSANANYQDLAKEYMAIETPIWAGMLANATRVKGWETKILDCEAERLTNKDGALVIIQTLQPRIICLVCYAQNPNDSTAHMTGVSEMAKELKKLNPNCKIVAVGPHMAALPRECLVEESEIDFICQNEGVYTILNLLKVTDFNDESQLLKVKGLGFRSKNYKRKTLLKLVEEEIVLDQNIILNEPEIVVPRNLLEQDLPGIAWDLLPHPSKYRTSGWHALSNGTNKSPFASIYTSLGCPNKCFPAGTKVITSDCPNKKIEDIRPGDKLISLNENTGLLEETIVSETKVFEENEIYEIFFENGSKIQATIEHPFYVKGKWITVKDLQIGDEIYHIDQYDKISLNKKWYNPVYNDDVRKSISNKIREHHKNGILNSVFKQNGFQKNHRPYSVNSFNREKNYKLSSLRMKHNNLMKNKDVRQKQSITAKNNIKKGITIPFMCKEAYWQTLKIKKNKTEEKFEILLENYFPGFWKFVGDGTVRYDYYSPDFINKDGDKIIELHGCYWHKCKQCFPHSKQNRRDVHRIKTFEKYGKKVLEIWIHELKDTEKLLRKISDFTLNGLKISKIEKLIHKESVRVYNFSCSPNQNYFVGAGKGQYLLSHNCDFCMINIINRRDNTPGIAAADSNMFRYWDPKFMIQHFDKLAELGVTNIKIADELFVLNPNHFMELCKLIKERGHKFNIWCYSRVDTCKPHYLQALRDAGVNWLALGIENPNQTMRREFTKGGFEEVKVEQLIKEIHEVGINIIGNYIFGLPPDTKESMRDTLEFAKSHLTEAFNLYPAQALPGSPLYIHARKEGWELPEKYSGYSMLGYETKNTRNANLTAAEILQARDEAWIEYHTHEPFLKMIEEKFGKLAREKIEESTKIKLKRKILGD